MTSSSPHPSPATPARGSRLWFVLAIAAIALLVLAYSALNWPSLTALQASLDNCTRPFCDFSTYYYPMGREILHTSQPVEGFMYSPFIALLFACLMLAFGSLGDRLGRKRKAYPKSSLAAGNWAVRTGVTWMSLARPGP